MIAGGTPTSDIEDVRSIDSGHADLIEGGLGSLACARRPRPPRSGRRQADRGYGSGSFGRAFFEHIEQARTTVSHSEPITVAAEQGVIGLAVYVALLVVALDRPARRRAGRLAAASRRRAPASSRSLVDSFGYTGFAIDPATWALLALGVGAARRSARGVRDDLTS